MFEQEFFTAATCGDIEAIKKYINLLDDIVASGNTALCIAAENGHLEIIQYLCSIPGINPGNNENEAMFAAADSGHLPIVEFLCSLPNINPADGDNDILCIAAGNGHLSIVQFLCQRSDVNPAARYNMPICLAANYGHLPVVEFLCALPNVNPIDCNPAWMTFHETLSMVCAAKNGHLPVVMFLYTHLCMHPEYEARDNASFRGTRTIEQTFELAYRKAAQYGHLEIVQFLSSHQDINQHAAFLNAIEYGHLAIVQFLCTIDNVDPAYSDNIPIRLAAGNGHLPVVQFLCTLPSVDPIGHLPSHDMEPNETSISCAAKNGHLSIVKFLYPHFNLNQKRELSIDGYSYTIRDAINYAFTESIINNHLSVVQYLFSNITIDLQPALLIATGEIANFLETCIATRCVATGRGIRSIPKIPCELAGEIIGFIYPENSKFTNIAVAAYRAKPAPRQYNGWEKTGDILVNNLYAEQSLLFSLHQRKARQLNTAATSIQRLWRGYKVRKQLLM